MSSRNLEHHFERTALRGTERVAIRPYPTELEEEVELNGRRLRLRPIRPEDFAQHKRFLSRCSPEDLHARFLSTFRELPDAEIVRLTQIDYDREMALIAEELLAQDGVETLAVARACTDPDNREAEFAILVRSDLKRHGLGTLLLGRLIRYCRDRGTVRLTSNVLGGNVCMRGLGASLGFTTQLAERGILEMSLELQSSGADRAPAAPRTEFTREEVPRALGQTPISPAAKATIPGSRPRPASPACAGSALHRA